MRVCAYASSSSRTPQIFLDAAAELGERVAKNGDVLINGGGRLGSMGAMNTAARAAGGRIVCVIHERWVVDGARASRVFCESFRTKHERENRELHTRS